MRNPNILTNKDIAKDAIKRVAIKRQLRKMGFTVPDAISTDTKALRTLRKTIYATYTMKSFYNI